MPLVNGFVNIGLFLWFCQSLGVVLGPAAGCRWHAGAFGGPHGWPGSAPAVLRLRGTRLVVQSLCGLGLVGRGPL
jgi:hypothetical protein